MVFECVLIQILADFIIKLLGIILLEIFQEIDQSVGSIPDSLVGLNEIRIRVGDQGETRSVFLFDKKEDGAGSEERLEVPFHALGEKRLQIF
jgi:hypothetical protein